MSLTDLFYEVAVGISLVLALCVFILFICYFIIYEKVNKNFRKVEDD